MANVTFKTDWCKGCGLCVSACPKGCLAISAEQINKKGYSPAFMAEPEKCIGCAFCATMCPDCIITVEK
jgi:2-oxoglutarate ferredoxin oxidoreductase subunit delta